MEEKIEIIIIANSKIGLSLETIFTKAPKENELRIIYNEKFKEHTQGILKMLRTGAGWVEFDSGITTTTNKKCKYNKRGCVNPKKLQEENIGLKGHLKCIDSVRKRCKYYKQEDRRKFQVNYTDIRKIGQVRGLK